MKNKAMVDWGLVMTFLVIGLLLGGAWIGYNHFFGSTGSIGGGTYVPPSTNNCADDGDTGLNINVKNIGNESASEGFDVTTYLYRVDGSSLEYVTSITDETSPNDSTIDCGYEYVLKAVGASGASGDSSVFMSVLSGDDDVRISNGDLHFFADGPSEDIIVGAYQHASLECRAYDLNQNAFVYDNAENNAKDYDTDGITWTSTTDNATAMDETLGLNLEIQCKAVESDTNYNDRGILVLVEAPTTSWDAPTVRYNGVTLKDIKDTGLTADEVKAYSAYEYAFLVPKDVLVLDAGEGITFNWVMDLAAGQSSASADPEFDIVPRSAALSVDGVNVVQGQAVDDTSSRSTIHTHFDTAVDVT